MGTFQVGDEILAPWLDDAFLYPAVLVATDGITGHVAYLDGEETDVPLASLRRGVLGPGLVASINWKGKGGYYGGRITHRMGSALYVHYDDGTQGWTTIAQCRVLKTVMAATSTSLAACSYCGAATPAEALRCQNCGAHRPGSIALG